jgi:hypothetical protein
MLYRVSLGTRSGAQAGRSVSNGKQSGPRIGTEATVDPPSRGSQLDADHPQNGVLIPCRFTPYVAAGGPRQRLIRAFYSKVNGLGKRAGIDA